VFKQLSPLVARGVQHAFQKHLLILLAARFVVDLGWPDLIIDGFKETIEFIEKFFPC
jgi:hypothetical protein